MAIDLTSYTILASITALLSAVPLMIPELSRRLKAISGGIIAFEMIVSALLFPLTTGIVVGTGLGGIVLAAVVELTRRRGN